MKQVFVHLDKCMGCRSCQIACAVEHSKAKSLFAAVAETPMPRYRLYVEKGDGKKIPLTCRHCEDAPCLEACISGALFRDDRGLVMQRYERCVGCWTCLMVCPFGVVGRQKERRVAVKCDRCANLEVPSCVSACPTRALVFAEEEAFGKAMRVHAAGLLSKAVEHSSP
ncbi:MAG: 4Fe-4S dicluster domain-containing protein [Thermodesulfobacteriota bacterium]